MILGTVILTVLIGLFVKLRTKVFDYLVIGLIACLMMFATNVPDFDNYSTVYNYIGTGARYTDTGFGWLFLCRLGNRLGLNYKSFSIALVVISGLLIANAVRYFLNNKRSRNYVWALYLVFPALLDAVQVRFFLAEAIIVFAMRYLMKKELKGYIIYMVLCFIATMIHTSVVLYFVFLLIPVFHKIRRYIVGLTGVLTVVMTVGRNQILKMAPVFANQLRLERYFNRIDAVGPFGIVAYTFTLIAFWYIAKCAYDHTKSSNCGLSVLQYTEIFYQITVLIWIVLPLTFFDTNFFRIQRPLWILLYILIALMRDCGIKSIVSNRYFPIGTKGMGIMMSCIGLVFYICIFNFNIIQAFLL